MPASPDLLARRAAIQAEIASLGDLRPGSLSPFRRKCGKPTCHCAAPGDPGHPGWLLTRKLKGKTHTRSVPARAVETVRRQLAEYRRLQRLLHDLVAVGEAICDEQWTAEAAAEAEKGGFVARSKPRSAGRSTT